MELPDVLREQPRPRAGDPAITGQKVQVLQSGSRLHVFRNLRPPAEACPGLLVEISVQREPATRGLVEADHALIEEELADLVPRHLRRRRSIAHVEPASEGVGLPALGRHLHAQHLPHAHDIHADRRLGGAGDGLDTGLQAVVALDAANSAVVLDTEQDRPAGRVGERADLTPQVGPQRSLELDGEPLAQRDQVGQDLHVTPPPPAPADTPASSPARPPARPRSGRSPAGPRRCRSPPRARRCPRSGGC